VAVVGVLTHYSAVLAAVVGVRLVGWVVAVAGLFVVV
jgi:hypothetical protein